MQRSCDSLACLQGRKGQSGFRWGVRGSMVDNDTGRSRSQFMQDLEGMVGVWMLFQAHLGQF